ncbi:MAG: ABC transporter permease [Microthrixaceae bacterium]
MLSESVLPLAIGLVFAAPLLYLVWRTLDLDSEFSLLVRSTTLVPLWRTVVLAAGVGFSTALIGTVLAWLLVRTDLPGRRWLRVVAALPLVLPSFVGATALLAGMTTGGLIAELVEPLGIESLPRIEGFWGAWFVLTLFTYPMVYLPVAARLHTLPTSLEESARLLGRGTWRTGREVVMPQAYSSIAAGTLLVVLYTISDFGVVSLLRYGTLTEEIYLSKLDPATWLPLSLVLAVLALVVTAGERSVARRRTVVVSSGTRPAPPLALGRWRWPAAAAVVLLVVNAVLGPLAVLGYWVVRGYRSGSSSTALALRPADLVGPTASTVVVSVVAAIVCVVVVLPVARSLRRRRRRRAGGLASVLVVAGYAMPGLIVALSLVFWTLSSDVLDALYQTVPLLILAYTIHFGAQAMRTAQVAVESVPSRMEDAARMLGAPAWRRFAVVELPIMLPGLLAGAGLVLQSAMKELPATLVLSPPGFSTLATEIWSAYEYGSYAQMGIAGIVLVAVSGVLTWLLVIRRSELL